MSRLLKKIFISFLCLPNIACNMGSTPINPTKSSSVQRSLTITINNKSQSSYFNTRIKIEAGNNWIELGSISKGKNVFSISRESLAKENQINQGLFEMQTNNGQWLISEYATDESKENSIMFDINQNIALMEESLNSVTLSSIGKNNSFEKISNDEKDHSWSADCGGASLMMHTQKCTIYSKPNMHLIMEGVGIIPELSLSKGRFTTTYSPWDIVYLATPSIYTMSGSFFYNKFRIIKDQIIYGEFKGIGFAMPNMNIGKSYFYFSGLEEDKTPEYFILKDNSFITYNREEDHVDTNGSSSDSLPKQQKNSMEKLYLQDFAKDIKAAMSYTNGICYFFLENGFYLRYDRHMKRVVKIGSIESNWLGLGPYANNIKAAFSEHPDIAYFFLDGKYNGQYIRYNMKEDHIESGYPKFIDNITWPGLGGYATRVKFIAPWDNGIIYFFLDDNTYVKYDLNKDKITLDRKEINDKTWPGLSIYLKDIVTIFKW